jgi:predicted lipoprotein with Yx(FWY)xxD motif
MTSADRAVRRRRGPVVAIVAGFALGGAALAGAATGATTVTTHHGRLGLMVAAANAHTVYLDSRDPSGKSGCYGSCASAWPPLISHGRPGAAKGSGLRSGLLGTTRRKNGALQVTYNGHALYLFPQDTKPGDMHGENVNGFFAVSPSGKALKPKKSSGGYGCPGCPQGY